MKLDLQTARRNLNSPNIKTRKRALKLSNSINATNNPSLYYLSLFSLYLVKYL